MPVSRRPRSTDPEGFRLAILGRQQRFDRPGDAPWGFCGCTGAESSRAVTTTWYHPGGRAVFALGFQLVVAVRIDGAGRLEGAGIALGRIRLEQHDGRLRRQRLVIDRQLAGDGKGSANARSIAATQDRNRGRQYEDKVKKSPQWAEKAADINVSSEKGISDSVPSRKQAQAAIHLWIDLQSESRHAATLQKPSGKAPTLMTDEKYEMSHTWVRDNPENVAE